MNVPSNIMAKRLERASELETFARLIDKTGLCHRTDLIYTAAKDLKDKTKGFHTPGTTDYACWGYNIENLTFSFDSLPERHIRPTGIHSMKMEIDILLLCNDAHWQSNNDPFINMNFNVRVIGSDSNREYSFGFHVDRHVGEVHSDEIHPIYHLQYNPLISNDEDLGTVLYLDSPRIMHVPVDLILGLDIAFSNFLPKTWNSLRNESEYQSLYSKYVELIWKPYVHTWATYWTYKPAELNWNLPNHICPYLI